MSVITKQTFIQVLKNNLDNTISSHIVDLVRTTNQYAMDNQESLRYLKINIEQHLKGKWQVVIGQFIAFYDQQLFPYRLELFTQAKKYTIFSRGTKQQKSKQISQNTTLDQSNILPE